VIEASPVATDAATATTSSSTEQQPQQPWTHDDKLLQRLIDGAQKHWNLDVRPHAINRLARALGLPTPGGAFAEFARLMREQYTGTPNDAWKAVVTYQTPEQAVEGAVVSWDEETPEGEGENE
jgi:hypothetical protein